MPIRMLQRLRIEMELPRRIRSTEARATAHNEIAAFLEQELGRGGLDRFGRRRLKEYFSYHGHFAARESLFAIYKTRRPEEVGFRRTATQRRRRIVLPQGPDEQWSIDAYCKFEQFGIEIYVGIDGYSRYITWIYVGILARTGISALNGYLKTVRNLDRIPQYVRSDRGTEDHHACHRSLAPQESFFKRRSAP